MKDFIRKKGIWILAAAFAVVLVSGITLHTGLNSDINSNALNTMLKPVKGVMNSLVDSLEKLYGYMYKYDLLEEKNRLLEEKVAKLEQEYREYTEISEENERLKALLNLSDQNPDYEFNTASVISWTASNWGSSFTINKGSSSNMEVGDPVITENGYLIGRITEVSVTSATVTTILDTETNIGALVSDTGEACIAQGDFMLMGEDKLKIGYLPDNYLMYAGNTVVTSGMGGSYPSGLIIGYVEDVVESSSGLDDYAVVTPAFDPDDLRFVAVITNFEIQG